MISRFAYAELAVSRWRNGGWETRELISYPPSAESFEWRASIATLAQDGPVSAFPGIDRITRLHGRISENFNIMTRHGIWQATVEVVTCAVSSRHGVAWVDETTRLSPLGANARLLLTRLSRVP